MPPDPDPTEESGPPEESDPDVDALQEAGYDTSDAGKGNDSFNAKTVGELTGSTSTSAAAAGHAARDDMAEAGDMGIPSDRHEK